MDDNDISMYGSDDDEEIVPVIRPAAQVDAVSNGMVTELDINGKRFEVVNPEYMREMQRIVNDLSNQIRALNRNVQTMSHNARQQARTISELRSQLDGKVDRGI